MDSNQFIVSSQKFDHLTFQQMVDKISATAHLSPTLLKNYGYDALGKWEAESGLQIDNLFVMHNLDRSANIASILSHFEQKIEPFVGSAKRLNKSRCIATVGYELLFSTL